MRETRGLYPDNAADTARLAFSKKALLLSAFKKRRDDYEEKQESAEQKPKKSEENMKRFLMSKLSMSFKILQKVSFCNKSAVCLHLW